ncbi:MAG TPA: isocitrate lyase/phosphoenolpyruvate mutase family protein, partial [Actinomycetota bacterium]|nr:isocitrate lyase/phosphoenolpyruvate mutase family protein [Actinomycetota bacterium]
DTVARLQAFESAGADVLFAPGLRTTREIAQVREAVSRPLNVLAVPGLSFSEIVAAGAQRVSVGGRLTLVAVKAMTEVAESMRDTGELSGLAAPPPAPEWLSD